MKNPLIFPGSGLSAALALLMAPTTATAAANDYFWTASGSGDGGTASGGSGTWDTTSSLWRNNTATGSLGAFPSPGTTNNANFGGTAGTVTLASSSNILVNQLLFTTSGYMIAGASGSKITLNGSNPTVSIGSGTVTVGAVLDGSSGSVGLLKTGAGTLILTGNNTFTGGKSFNGGITRVTSIGNNSATSSNLGSSGGIGFNNGTLEYAGAGETTDRAILLAGSGRIDNYGFGTLTLNGTFTATQTSAATLITGGSGNVIFANNIVNSSTHTTAFQAFGSGTTTLSGANTFTGGLAAGRNNTLVLDYANAADNSNNAVVNSANALALSAGGTLYVKGKSPTTTAQTLGNVSYTDSQNNIVVDNNGGGGTSLALGTLTRTSNYGSALLIDISSGATVTANTTGGWANGVLTAGASATSTASVTIKTISGYDFAATTIAGTNQNITALGASAPLPTSLGSSSSADNYKLSASGSSSVSTGGTIGTLRVDTTNAAGGSLVISSGNTVTVGKNTLLFDGNGSYSISGGTLASGNNSFLAVNQYSTGTVTISSAISSLRIDKFGFGTLVNNSTSALGNLHIHGGVYRAGNLGAMAQSGSTANGFLSIGGGGVLELGSHDLTARVFGATAGGLIMVGDGGFSAYGGNRVVAIGGLASPTAVTWGTTVGFVGSSGSSLVAGSGNKLILSSSTSDSTVDFRNAIDFNGLQREVSVGNGSAGNDAILSGVLSSSVAGGGLYKSGAGTLALTATNTYTGTTTVSAGTLNVTGSLSTGTVSVSGTLTGTGSIGGATTINSGGVHNAGNVGTAGKQTFSTSVDYASGSIFEWDLAADPATPGRGTGYDAVNATSLGTTTGAIFRVVLNGSQDFSSTFWDVTQQWTDIFKTSDAGDLLSFASIFSGPVQYYNASGAITGVPSAQGSFSISGSTLTWTAVPEPGSALCGLLIGAGLLRRRRA